MANGCSTSLASGRASHASALQADPEHQKTHKQLHAPIEDKAVDLRAIHLAVILVYRLGNAFRPRS